MCEERPSSQRAPCVAQLHRAGHERAAEPVAGLVVDVGVEAEEIPLPAPRVTKATLSQEGFLRDAMCIPLGAHCLRQGLSVRGCLTIAVFTTN